MDKKQRIKIITIEGTYETTINVSYNQGNIDYKKIMNEMKKKNCITLDDGFVIDAQKITKVEPLNNSSGKIGF